jgi:hypothetical protein
MILDYYSKKVHSLISTAKTIKNMLNNRNKFVKKKDINT